MHLFFDLDNTVTRSRTPILPDLKNILTNTEHDIIIVSGAICNQIAFQMDGTPCYKLGQNGNHALDPDDNVLWEERLTPEQEAEIHQHIHSIPRNWEVTDENDLVQDRGCQISYSLLGHKENLDKKEAFDPHGDKRKALLKDFPFNSETLEVKIGGTTCFDYVVKGRHKGAHVARLIEEMDWNTEDCIYFGDMLFPGGNDETVIGVIKTQAVENPADTAQKLRDLGLTNL